MDSGHATRQQRYKALVAEICEQAQRKRLCTQNRFAPQACRASSDRGQSVSRLNFQNVETFISRRRFQRACIAKLSAYLRSAGFSGSGSSARTLSKPTQRDFEDVALFLFSRLDPSWRCERKFEDEFVDMFRMLHYPFTISRTVLAAVGTSHTWPPLLAALTWLVELVVHSEKWPARPPSGEDEGRNRFNEYAANAYSLFLSGDDEAAAQLRSRLEAAFEATRLDAKRETEGARALSVDTRDQCSRLRSEAAHLPDVVERRGKLRQSRADLEERITALRAEAAKHERRAAAATATAADRRRRAAIVRRDADAAEVARLKLLHDADAARRLDIERDALMAELVAAKAELAELQRKAVDVLKLAQTELQATSRAARSYDRSARALQLVPASAKNADGKDLSLLPEEENSTHQDESEDVLAAIQKRIKHVEAWSATAAKARNCVRPALAEVIEALRSRSLEVRRKLSAAKREVERAELDRDEAAANLDSAKAHLETVEMRLERDADRELRGSVSAARDAKLLRDEADALATRLDDRRRVLDAKRADLRALEATSEAEIANRANLLVRRRAELGCLADQCVVLANARRQQTLRLQTRITDATDVLDRDSKLLHKATKLRDKAAEFGTSLSQWSPMHNVTNVFPQGSPDG